MLLHLPADRWAGIAFEFQRHMPGFSLADVVALGRHRPFEAI
jgi:hypothetical protein